MPVLFLYGAIISVCQILFSRYLLSLFQGNESVFGFVLCFWLFFTAIGVMLVPVRQRQWIQTYKLLPCLSFLCLFEIILSTILQKYLGFTFGEILSVPFLALQTALLLLPFCVLSGIIFRFAVAAQTNLGDSTLGKAYLWESLGMGLGGIVFYLALPFLKSGLEILAILLFLSFIPMLTVGFQDVWFKRIGALVLIILCAWSQIKLPALIGFAEKARFGKQKILLSQESEQGQIHLTELENEPTLYLNHVPIASLGDRYHAEELACALIPHLRGSSLQFFTATHQIPIFLPIIKADSSISEVDAVFWSDKISQAISMMNPNFNPSPLSYHEFYGDPLKILLKSKKKYNGILWDLPKPVTLQTNRYYTLECFKIIKSHLAEEGIFVVSMEASEDFIGEEMAASLRALWNTLSDVFENKTVLPGNNYLFIARNGQIPLFDDVDSLLDHLPLKPGLFEYMNRGFLPFRLSQERIRFANQILNFPEKEINRNFNPVLQKHEQ